jgi:SAM-dependent methyltransferase
MTNVAHWDGVWSRVPSMRLPSRLFVTTQDRMRLLRRYLKPGMRFLELGCAPAKMLAWVATQGVQVAGMDYSAQGIEWGRQLMRALGLEADLRCEDLFSTTFSRESFDLVHSAGLIEHFDDPVPLVEIHLGLVRRGGTVLISVPNYGGFYGAMGRRFGPSNFALHNLVTASRAGMESLRRQFPGMQGHVKGFGRCFASRVLFDEKLPYPVGALLEYATNGLGLIQPFRIGWLCPHIVLELVKPL